MAIQCVSVNVPVWPTFVLDDQAACREPQPPAVCNSPAVHPALFLPPVSSE